MINNKNFNNIKGDLIKPLLGKLELNVDKILLAFFNL